jgi:NAD(P)-dependent dehydrogenase (short-subunit alcohol dehydrogenase family)
MSLHDKVVMVTGAAGHLGRAVVAHFAQQGSSLVLLDRRIDPTPIPFANERTQVLAADVLDRDSIRAAYASALSRFGRIDILCHLVGGFRMGDPVHGTDAATWDLLVDLNARSLLNVANAVVPDMIRAGAGKVVTVGALSALKGVGHMGAYCASKAGVIRLTEAMSAELRDKHINVNCVLPSIIDTADNRAAMPDADPSAWVTPQSLAQVIAFLCSEAARDIHGACIPVSGRS